jgi:hypothetical protein
LTLSSVISAELTASLAMSLDLTASLAMSLDLTVFLPGSATVGRRLLFLVFISFLPDPPPLVWGGSPARGPRGRGPT